jgi:hypothetical protein
MTELPPPDEPAREQRADADEPLALPRWVPISIGLVLVALAGLAVYTGIRYRSSNTLVGIVRPKHVPPRATGGGPPGEPGPGSSLVFPGEGGDNAPVAREPGTGRARAEITGGAGASVVSTVRLSARRGMMTRVTPDDAMVFVNDVAIGAANQFNSQDDIYDFPAAGSYVVRITAPGYEDRQFTITASESAKAELAVIDVKLTPVVR